MLISENNYDKIFTFYGGILMNRIELLAPAGNMECLKASVMAGCDAVYLGGNHFGARAFSKNFSREEIVQAINYCHLYGVKVYIKVNTLIYDDEVEEFLRYIEFIHKNNVDAVLIQDLGMFDLVRKTYPELEIHASTQMHINNLDGVKLMEELGMKRVVLPRELSLEEIKEIKDNSTIELEVFVHGALCVSYSGQCLMSSLIGGRSGNRGACAGSCRLKYDVVDEDGKKLNKFSYPLSMKDLNSLENVGNLIESGVSSLKIEGRMKSVEYVYMVVSMYREAIDSYYKTGKVMIDEDKFLKLKKIFNREYTKGFLGGANNSDVINGYSPNHMGVVIGKVIGYDKGMATICLSDNLVIGSGLRVIGRNKDVGILVNEFYINNKLVKEAKCGDTIKIRVNDKVEVNDKVVITLDKSINLEVENDIKLKPRKVMIKGTFIGKKGDNIRLILSDYTNTVEATGSIVEGALKTPTSELDVMEKLNKIGDSIYSYNDLEIIMDDDIFIPLKEINDIKRRVILDLNNKRLYKTNYRKEEYKIEIQDYAYERNRSVLVNNVEDISRLSEEYDTVYCYEKTNNSIWKTPRVIWGYPDNLENALVGEIGSFYKGHNLDTDFSFNVVNSYTVAFLHSLGARRITLSYEMNDRQIKNLLNCYEKRYKKHPNLELIVEGYEEVMITKYNLEEDYGKKKIYLRDMFGNYYKVIVRDGMQYIYNYKKREMDEAKYYDWGINSFRFNMDT